MKEEAFLFESYGTMVVGIHLEKSSPKVAHFHIVEAVDYPDIDHDTEGNEVGVVKYFNLIGQDGEIVEEVNQANLIASGNIVLQYPEDKENMITYTIEFQSGIVFNGKEFNHLAHLIQVRLLENAFRFLNNLEMDTLERVPVDFSNV